MPRGSKKKPQKPLRDSLVLNKYFCHLFGFEDFKAFREGIKKMDVDEGYNEEGISYMALALLSRGEKLKISPDKLREYDSNIREYVEKISRHRPEAISLKYFQYLAVLFTEIYLDKYFTDPVAFVNEIDDFVYKELGDTEHLFSKDDVRKIAFWMATGSGKTLIFHINYLQFMKYNTGPNAIKYNNILLITPSESLSKQHMDEMELSGIKSSPFRSTQKYYFGTSAGKEIRVIDIHKFTDEKKGSGVTIDIEEFGNKNIIFVDEGHKGSGGKKWRSFRETVATEGFTFEYSATFGEAVSKAKDLLKEYSKSIIFDYSYPFFYGDGYGKDYRILNLKKEVYDAKDVLMLANALTYYEQKLLFENEERVAEEYNIENPLWIIVGAHVNKKNAVEEADISDILQVILSLKKILQNDDNWAVKTIANIIDGKSGILDQSDRDLFSPEYPERKLQYIHDHFSEKDSTEIAEKIYNDMLKRVFHVNGSAPIHLENLKSVAGEIGLRAGASTDYFGVINIGDTSSFSKHARENDVNVVPAEFSKSLFNSINSPHSKINILIGAKKFMEGWNSWRVSTMGLLRVGKNEGTQIIQLFGRGVRLKGKNMSLKRSSEVEINPPKYLNILETLGIFGIRADYMEKFKEYLEGEDIKEPPKETKPLKVKIKRDYFKEDLVIPKIDAESFNREVFVKISGDEGIHVTVDINPRADVKSSTGSSIATVGSPTPRKIDKKVIPFLNWERIYFAMLDYRYGLRWNNLLFTKESLKKVIDKEDNYTLYCPEKIASPATFEDIAFTEDAVISILKKYVKQLYTRKRRKWAEDNIDIESITEEHENIIKEYTISIPETEEALINELETFLTKQEETSHFKPITLENHIYHPLLALEGTGKIKVYPAPMNKGEKRFIEDLKSYLDKNPPELSGKKLIALRNLPRKGIGFYEIHGFYPDFILWVKDENDNTQTVIFVEPHGMTHVWAGKDMEKIHLSERIKSLERKLHAKGRTDIFIESYIISVSKYESIKQSFNNLTKKELENLHILFQEDNHDYIRTLLDIKR